MIDCVGVLTFGEHLEVFSQVIHEQLSHIVASWLVSSVLPPAAQLVGL